ncbi:hypothetical protein N5P37_001987, partial [Trichoderma harzianum]
RGPARSWPTATSAATWCHQVLHHSACAIRCPFSSLCSPPAAPSTPGPAAASAQRWPIAIRNDPLHGQEGTGPGLFRSLCLCPPPAQACQGPRGCSVPAKYLYARKPFPPQTFPSSFVQRHASRSFRHSFTRFRCSPGDASWAFGKRLFFFAASSHSFCRNLESSLLLSFGLRVLPTASLRIIITHL